MAPNVNVVTDNKVKDADITQKCQLYGIFQAFALGKAPSNKQIDVAMNSALKSRALANPSKQLSHEGRELIGDVRDVIEKAKILFLTKNEGNLLQDFAWSCQNVGTGNASAPGMPVDKDTAKQQGNEALEGLKTLGTLLITNGQFRKLIDDALVLARDIAGDGASKLADSVNPDEERLNRIDEPAEDNTWHDEPDFKGMKDQVVAKKDQAMSKAKSAKDQARGPAQDTMDSAQNDAQNSGSKTGALKAAASNVRGGAMAAKDQARGQADSNMSEEDKQKAKDTANDKKQQVKDYMGEKMPKERREQIIFRLKKMIVEIQGHEDYQRAIDTLLRLAEQYKGHAKNVTKDTAGSAKGLHADTGLNSAEADLRVIMERFANNTSLDDLMDSINQIYLDAANDPELKGWFSKLDTYIRKCLKEQGYVLKDQATEEWNQIYDKGDYLLRERYKNHTNRILDESKFFFTQFDEDPLNHAFADSMNKLFKDLGTDNNGKPTFKPHLLKDLRDVIIPEIINSIRYIPIPDIEFTSTDADIVIRDLVVEADNIFPNIIDVNSDNHFRFGRKEVKSAMKNKFLVHVSGIQTHLTDIRFYAKTKKVMTLRNWGLMDVTLANTGLDFTIAMETADHTDRSHFFKVTKVDVKISNLKLAFHNQHHPILTKVAGLFAKGPLLQAPIKLILEQQIKKAVGDLDEFCYGIYQDVQKASKEAKNDPENSTNVFKQYFNAYKEKTLRQKEDKQRKAEKAKRTAQEHEVETNIAFTRDQRISKNWNNGRGLPIDTQEEKGSGSGRFTLKAQEFKDLAYSGKNWESPVFSLGSASESSNLPRVPAVQKKPHETAPSETRGGQTIQRDDQGTSSGLGSNSASTGAPYTTSQPSSSAYQSTLDPYATNGTTSMNGPTSGGITGASGSSGVANSAHTTLGISNPVLTGRV